MLLSLEVVILSLAVIMILIFFSCLFLAGEESDVFTLPQLQLGRHGQRLHLPSSSFGGLLPRGSWCAAGERGCRSPGPSRRGEGRRPCGDGQAASWS